MERYFLGNNTAYGFYSNYERELRNMDRVVLLKGGPGTGKSSMLKRIAGLIKARGLDFELWYCSGDPKSLDGVMIKDKKIAIIDATAPHAVGADLPILRDRIFDLANSLDYDKLKDFKSDIVNLINNKKQCFAIAYRHLKCALCHYNNLLDIQKSGVDDSKIRAYAAVLANELRPLKKCMKNARELFVRAICPSGESEYFDHLKNKSIFIVKGIERSIEIFFEEMKALGVGDVYYLNPLNAKVDGMIVGDRAIVCNNGVVDDEKCDVIDLSIYENIDDVLSSDERNNMCVQVAFAREILNKAKDIHLLIEKYYISAMDFKNNDQILKEILQLIFVE